MSELKDKGYNEKRYIPDTKVIQIDPLGAALDAAGHEGGAGKNLRKKSNDYKLRIDPYSTVTLFSNNKDFLLELGSRLRTNTTQFWEPNPDHINILKSKTKIQIVDEIPKLPLKVWFNSTRINQDFANWLRANDDKCKIGKIALQSLEDYGYLNGLYIYLRDEKILNLVTLLAGSSIRSVEKLVYRGNIDKY